MLLMDELKSPITTIPCMGFRMATMILAEEGDFARFGFPDKLLAYANASPDTCAMPFTTQPISATRTRLLLHISQRNGRKASTSMSRFLTLSKIWLVYIFLGKI